jgi:hypothetical protein
MPQAKTDSEAILIHGLPWDQRADLATRVIGAETARIGDWTFASRTTPLRFKIFGARRE